MLARWKENPSQEYWERVIIKIHASKFLTGQIDSDKRNWRITFDWLIVNNDHAVWILEGKYDDHTPPKKPTPPTPDYLKPLVKKRYEGI